MYRNYSQNRTEENELDSLSTYVIYFFRVGGCIIILINLLILLTVSCNKSKFNAIYSVQIICLSANDLLAGVATFFLSFIHLPGVGDNFVKCTTIVTCLITTQSASLCNVFGIAVHRFHALRKITTRNIRNHNDIIATSISSWIFSSLFCGLPVFLYGDSENFSQGKPCSMYAIYGDKTQPALLISMVGAFLIPLFLVNVIYVTLLCRLSSITLTTAPLPDIANTVNSTKHVTSSFHGNNSAITKTRDGNQTLPSHKNVTLQGLVGTSRLQVPDESHVPQNNCAMSPSTLNVTSTRSSATTFSSFVPSSALRIRRAFIHTGFVLLFINIFSLPGTFTLIIRNISTKARMDRDIYIFLFGLLCLNSLINPVLYAAVLPEFRESVIERLQKLRRSFVRQP